MSEFPRTKIEELSVSRMIVGTNWFLGFSHTSKAKDEFIKRHMTPNRIADVLEVFLRAGVDTAIGLIQRPAFLDAVKDAEDRTGRKCIIISTPHLNVADGQAAADENGRTLDEQVRYGASICMPHANSTDALLDRTTRTIRKMDGYCAMIRERGMIPGLSTHMPEVPIYADETNLDVGTYIQIYNAIGFLMQIEIEWVQRVIQGLKKPVMAIKPMAAGRLTPLVGLSYAWATLRDIDMVTVGTMTPDEAKEVIEVSLAQLERRQAEVELQRTRSKKSIDGK